MKIKIEERLIKDLVEFTMKLQDTLLVDSEESYRITKLIEKVEETIEKEKGMK